MRILIRIAFTFFLLLVPFVVGVPSANAATINVITETDSGAGSLRQAIADATSGDTINFDSNLAGKTITLSSPLGIGTKTISINGGDANIAISGNNTVQVFTVSSGGTLTLENLTVKNGTSKNGTTYNWGGGIYSSGVLSVTNCTFENNSAGNGGGIYSSGTLTITKCIFQNNSADGNGGGIDSSDELKAIDCRFENNSAANGGGIFNSSHKTLMINNCTFKGNTATGQGGGLYIDNDLPITVTDCTFSDNTATSGGGIYTDNVSTLTVTNCTFSGNAATDSGGIYNYRGVLTVTNCIFKSNSSEGNGGGISSDKGLLTVSDCTFQSNSSGGNGGGVHALSLDTLNITSSTFESNTAVRGGALYKEDGQLKATNCTFSGNSSTTGNGGGAYLYSTHEGAYSYGTKDFTNCTFSNNTAMGGGGIWNYHTKVTLTNCIVWNSQLGGESYTVGYSDIDDANYAGSNNNISVDPLLGTLGDYGGPVRTIPLLPGSPAIDAGTAGASIPATDARNISRAFHDMGAFESQGFTITIANGNNQTSLAGTPFTDSLKVSVASSNSEPVDGGKVSFIAPYSGASSIFDVNPATIALGSASVNATANDVYGGPYTVIANAAGATSANFSLTNQPQADLAITISCADNLIPGENTTFTITVTNNGPSSAASVCVTDLLPAGTQFVSSSLNPGTFSNNGGIFSGIIGTLASGNSMTFTLTVKVDPSTILGSLITNNVTATSPTMETNYSNNSATITRDVIAPTTAGFTITPTTLTITEGGIIGNFTVCLNSPPTGDVTLPVTASDISEISVSPASLTFTSANWSMPQTVTVTPVDDDLIDGNQMVKVIVGLSVSVDPKYSCLNSKDVTITVFDNDTLNKSGGGSGKSSRLPDGSAYVNPSIGGKVSLNSNITLNIPEHALPGSNSLLVKIKKVGQTPTLPSGFRVMDLSYEITIDGKDHFEFNKPVSISFTFDPSQVPAGEAPAIYYYESSTSRWVRIDGKISGNTISVEVEHFTIFGVLVKEKSQSDISISFSDIENNWARESIKKLAGMGAVSGYPDGTFRPDAKITRGEFVTILVKALNLSSDASVPVFSDTVNHFAKDSIATAVALDIVRGYDGNTFKPNDPITREQMAVIAIKALKQAETSGETTFRDNSKISAWAKASVLTAIKNNIMKGYPNNTFKPLDNATRAEALNLILSLVK